MTSESILDIILEKTCNIESETNQTKIQRTLDEAIKLNSRRERDLRGSTLTIKLDETTRDDIDSYFEDYVKAAEELPVNSWQDKQNVYVQFTSIRSKRIFLESVKNKQTGDIIEMLILTNLKEPNDKEEHFTRRPVRMEINNVKSQLKTQVIKQTLETMLLNSDGLIEFKESRTLSNKSRNIYFRVTQKGFEQIIGSFDGVIPYSEKSNGKTLKNKLYTKISAKPYRCRECFRVGPHSCQGKLCTQCSKVGHLTKDCKSKTKYCDNCTRKGHRLKDLHCPFFLNEVSKEIRKMDFPLEYLEEEEFRFALIKHLQLK